MEVTIIDVINNKLKRVVIVAPAGCGKTTLIAKAVACQNDGCQLILTHTHAGVKSLRDKLREERTPSKLYRVDTIAGFALRYAVSFPKTSGIKNLEPVNKQDWNNVYEGAKKILSQPFGQRIIKASYAGLYVDEYQDCSPLQHEIIMSLGEMLPCRIVGDPCVLSKGASWER